MSQKTIYRLPTKNWNIERAVFLIAGIFVFLSVLLGFLVSAKWFYFTGFVGLMLVDFSLTGFCPLAMLLDRLGVKRK